LVYCEVISGAVWFIVKLLKNNATVKTNYPHFFHFRIDGLEQLVKTYGRTSPQLTDALTLLKTVSQRVSFMLFMQSLAVVSCNNSENCRRDF